MSFGSRHKKLTWGRFHKAKMLAFYYWRENANKIVLALKTPHVANLSICVAHFGAIVAHFGVLKNIPVRVLECLLLYTNSPVDIKS